MSEINLWEIESELPFELICGVDEAGRGPLAGPVCAAAPPSSYPRPVPTPQ